MDSQRLLLYCALTLVVYMIWLAWERDYGTQPAPGAQVERQDVSKIDEAPAAAADVPEAPAVPETTRQSITDQAAPVSRRIRVLTDVLHVQIDRSSLVRPLPVLANRRLAWRRRAI